MQFEETEQRLDSQRLEAENKLDQLRYEAEAKVDHLRERLREYTDQQAEIEKLQEYVKTINCSTLVYKPVASDNVDCYLADIFNNCNKYNFERGVDTLTKAKMLFVREKEGHYIYNGKKMYIKKEGDQLVVRVGGGYMSLEEFLEQNYPFNNVHRPGDAKAYGSKLSHAKQARPSPPRYQRPRATVSPQIYQHPPHQLNNAAAHKRVTSFVSSGVASRVKQPRKSEFNATFNHTSTFNQGSKRERLDRNESEQFSMLFSGQAT